VNLFRRRGFNIDSLTVGPTESSNISRMTLVVNGDDMVVEQVVKQLYKVIDVLKVSDVTEERVVVRELALLKVSTSASTRAEVMQLVDIFRAKIVDVASDSVIVEVTGPEEKIDSLFDLVKRFGVREMARTGRIVMTRGVGSRGLPQPGDNGKD
jgi:acetolactate synthase-1/3 small subunit